MKFEHAKPISEKLSEALKMHISNADRAELSIQSSVSVSTIRELMYRNISVTENNEPGLILMIETALANCEATEKIFKTNKKIFKKHLRE